MDDIKRSSVVSFFPFIENCYVHVVQLFITSSFVYNMDSQFIIYNVHRCFIKYYIELWLTKKSLRWLAHRCRFEHLLPEMYHHTFGQCIFSGQLICPGLSPEYCGSSNLALTLVFIAFQF